MNRRGDAGKVRKIAVAIPCLNEAMTIGKVVCDIRKHLPEAEVYVFDNASTDSTAKTAGENGALVITSPRRGKGYVIQHIAQVVDADLYVLIDGDGTYPADTAPALVEDLVNSGVDMLVATRLSDFQQRSFRRYHRFGNRLVTGLISRLFSTRLTDVMSGYRILTRNFLRSLPLKSTGFEVETEMTLHALARGFLIKEVPVPYGTRAKGGFSKLNTYSDGYLILKAILILFKDYKPFAFFLVVSILLGLGSLAAGTAPIRDYYRSGYVYHVPLAILAASLGVLSILTLGIGLILDTISRYHYENLQLWKRHLQE